MEDIFGIVHNEKTEEATRLIFEELKRRNPGMKNFHVSWGPSAHTMSPHELYEEFMKHQREIEEYHAMPLEDRQLDAMIDAYKDFKEILELCKRDICVELTKEESSKRLSKIHGIADVACIHLRNHTRGKTKKSTIRG